MGVATSEASVFEWVAGCGYDTAASFLTALREKQERAWRLVLGDWRNRLTRIYHRRSDVEDIASEAVRRFWGAVCSQSVDQDQDLRGYFITIGVRCAIDLRRRQVRCEGTDPATLPWSGEPIDDSVGERDRLVWEALLSLSDGERVVVLRRVVSDSPYEAIAHELAIQPGTCRVRYLRAIRKLRDHLREWEVDLEVGESIEPIPGEAKSSAPVTEGF